MSSRNANTGAQGGSRRSWWQVRWSGGTGVHNERRHLAILSVLGGVVFFGAGLLGSTASTRSAAAPQSANTGSFSATSDVASNAQSASGAKIVNTASTTSLAGMKDGSLTVHMYNAYTKNNPTELYPWEHNAEPHKPSTMELLDWPSSDVNIEYR